ncbi:recombinase family protein [Rhodococcus sp. A14]|uniref:recombinase family protein n=1 Tax=Rhodococcus sp. A14 TaxID=1194106 RepID=UPI0032178BBA
MLTRLREDDVLVITRLDRLGRSMLHLITLGADLRERGIGLAEGRAMFGMLSVLAEFQRELIVANTRDGLAAARARGRKGGRPSKLSQDQIELAQHLYDAGDHTVAQIAGMLKVPRTTVYGHLDQRARNGTTRRIPEVPETAAIARTSRSCPTCGHEPTTRAEASHQRADLAVIWLHPDPQRSESLICRSHCRHCEPDQPAFDIACAVCGDGPILAGALAESAAAEGLSEPVQRWLIAAGWATTPTLRRPDHK